MENEGAKKQRVSRGKDGRRQFQLSSIETDMTNREEYREGKMETGLWRNAERSKRRIRYLWYNGPASFRGGGQVEKTKVKAKKRRRS